VPPCPCGVRHGITVVVSWRRPIREESADLRHSEKGQCHNTNRSAVRDPRPRGPPQLKMVTGKMPADTGAACPRPRPKFRARTRARHPPRAASHARACYPRACLARGHARVPARSRRRPPGPLPSAGSGSLAPCACV